MIYGIYKYNLDVYTVVLCHEDPKRDFNCKGMMPRVIWKFINVYFTQDELWDKYDNVINKIKHKIELDDNEALDLAFLGKFISKKNAQFVLESIVKVFNDSIIPKQKLKIDVAVVTDGMILKHFPDVKKQKQLLERLKMNV